MHRFHTLFLATALAALMAAPAVAAPLFCATPREAIINLRAPHMGSVFAWDATYGQPDKMLQLASGMPDDDGTVKVVGRTVARDGGMVQDVVLAALNRRNRVDNEFMWPVKDEAQPVKILPAKDGYVVLSNYGGADKAAHHGVRLQWVSKAGKVVREATLADDQFDYRATALAALPDKGGFLVAAQAVEHRHGDNAQGVIARFGAGGGRMWARRYATGAASEIDGISYAGNKNFLALGSERLDDGRQAGWALSVNADGAVNWQQLFPRGGAAVLKSGAAAPDNSPVGEAYIVMGQVTPADNGASALWMMALNDRGAPLWQRYLRAKDFALSPVGLLTVPDGRLLAAVNAKAAGAAGGRDHIRLLTLSPHAGLLSDEAYIEGIAAEGFDFTRGWNGERIVTATITSDQKALDTPNKGQETRPVQQGWVFVADAPDAYTDHCDKP